MEKPEKPETKDFIIPAEGSLGLLALGYRGLVIWRKRRQEVRELQAKMTPKKEDDGKKDS
jgi:hypothetical protein